MASGDFRDRLLAGLGGEWPKGGDLDPHVQDEKQEEGFRRCKLTYQAEPGEPSHETLVTAYPIEAMSDAKSRKLENWESRRFPW